MCKLYVIPTPIGNLKDISLRAIEILKEVDIVLSEDTRKSSVLFNHYGIKTSLRSHHKFNEHKEVKKIADIINSGKTVALITDAGTPGISDPGFLLVRTCLENGIEVESIPGATAFIPALINSGLPCDRFCFEGFLPHKKGRQKRISLLSNEDRTMVFYESPYRIIKLIDQLVESFGPDRQASLSRELTKLHEENIRGSLSEIAGKLKGVNPKGEFVLVVAGCSNT